ncbi:MAG: DUF4465 domain-containing protein [Dysgonamonadaceae bacterium]|jgi:hypothetical protein|nr:DUF4465 domain-containing protein [Dysgonamonadaceae bacterium]
MKNKRIFNFGFILAVALSMAWNVAAQQSQSFAEHWFGVKPQNSVLHSTKSTPQKAPAKAKLRAANANSSGVITLDLSQPTHPATFTLDANGVWTETYNDVDYPFIEFNNSAFNFSHLGAGEGDAWGGYYWDGFTYSKNGDNTDYGTDWVSHQWGNMAGGGIKTDAQGNVLKDENGVVLADPDVPYLLAYWGFMDGYYEYPTLSVIFDDVYQAKEVYINNSPWSYYGNIHTDGFSTPFAQEGDYFKLFIHGLNENYEDNGNVVEYVLAEFKNGALRQSPNWEKVDLSALGEVGGIYFTMESTDSDPIYGMNTAAYFCIDKLQVAAIQTSIPEHTFTITVPEGASVYVGAKGSKHYVPFTEKEAVFTSTSEGNTTFYYNVSGQHNYRVSKEGALTQAGLFTPSASSTSLGITNEQLYSHSSKEIDRDVNNNSGYNVADIFLNINEKGHLKLSAGDTYQLINLRTWQLTNSTVGNYFIEPDFHYTVINENGVVDNSVVTINSNGLLTAAGNGTAIVLVTYDAINAHSALGGPFFGALWAENTGVFVVSVGATASDITSGILINETMNTNSDYKLSGSAVDGELDIFYYLEETGGYDYAFTPVNVNSVTLAQPALGNNVISYTGFSTDGVTANADGSYTVRLVHGRNIVRMTSASGAVDYQVLSAKPVTYTVSNLTNPNEKFSPGDEASVKFNTLYHPANKLSGIYNMSAGIQYSNGEANFAYYLGAGQYTFASRAQEYKITIPKEFTEDEFLLTNGVIKAMGYGSPYGDHRKITLENGVAPNMNAAVKTAYFGALPAISISLKEGISSVVNVSVSAKINVYPNPFTDYIIVNTIESGTATIYDLSGKALLAEKLINGSNRIDVSSLSKGIYVLKVGESALKIAK